MLPHVMVDAKDLPTATAGRAMQCNATQRNAATTAANNSSSSGGANGVAWHCDFMHVASIAHNYSCTALQPLGALRRLYIRPTVAKTLHTL